MHYLCLTRLTPEHSVKGGMEVHQKVLAEGLVNAGHRVTVVTTRGSGGFVGEKIIGGAKYIFTDTPKVSSFATWNPLWYVKKSGLIEKLHAEHHIDVAWAEGGSAYGALSVLSNLGIPYIPIAQGTIPGDLISYFRQMHSLRDFGKILVWSVIKGYLWIRYELAYLKKAAHIIVVSNELKKEMVTYYKIDPARISVVYNGVSPAVFFKDSLLRENIRTQLAIPHDAFVAVCAGRIIREKGFHFALRALKAVLSTYPNTYLMVLGKGEYEKELEELADSLKITEHVRFVGFISRDEINAYYNAADCMIAATLRNEGFPLIFCEAMLAGLPIIASPYGGNPSAVTHDETGILLKKATEQTVTKAWEQLLRDETFRKTLGTNALAKAQAEFTDSVMVQRTEAIFQKFLVHTL